LWLLWLRGRWLLGLLVLQSTSSFVLDSYQDLLKVSNDVQTLSLGLARACQVTLLAQ
jgi:hypothetical protein